MLRARSTASVAPVASLALAANSVYQGIALECEPAFLCGLAGFSTEANNVDYTGTVVVSSTSGNIEVSGS